jgi:glycine/D-amino acid oxidase-like deaminating enzyme
MSGDTKNIVIVGGGIIGCTIAYYLTRHTSYQPSTIKVIILEASVKGVAQGASGKAGGLVAKWAYPKPLVDVSFREHVRLAEEHNGSERYGWRFVGCGSWEGKGDPSETIESRSGVGKGGKRVSLEKTNGLEGGQKPNASTRRTTGLPDDLDWVREDLTDSYSSMAPAGHTAQVHPYLFTKAMLELAQEKGVELIIGRATSIDREDGKITGITYVQANGEQRSLSATDIVISAGAWSPHLVPTLPISGTRAHSITIMPQTKDLPIAPYVLFTEISLPGMRRASPEIYARPTNEVYCCGPGDDSLLPQSVDQVVVDEAACESIRKHVCSISTQLKEGVVEKKQACFLPIVRTGGGPLIGKAPKIAQGLYVATGHTCWVHFLLP